MGEAVMFSDCHIFCIVVIVVVVAIFMLLEFLDI